MNRSLRRGESLRKRHAAPGFTLLEMVVVIAIIGIAAAMALPSISASINREKSFEEARLAARALQDARNTARNMRQCVTVSVAATTMQLDVEEPCGVVLSTTTLTFTRVTLTPIVIPFNLEGGLDNPAPADLVINHALGAANIYRVFGAIGQIERVQ